MDSEVIKLLKETNARISLDDKWLVYFNEEYHVLQRPPYAKKNRVLYRGVIFATALDKLRLYDIE